MISRSEIRPRPGTSSRTGGFALVLALFIVLVLSGIAVTVANISITQNDQIRLAVKRARVNLAQDAAFQWAVYRLDRYNLDGDATTTQPVCPTDAEGSFFFDESGRYSPDKSGVVRIKILCSTLNFSETGAPNPTRMARLEIEASGSDRLGNRDIMHRRSFAVIGPFPPQAAP